ncbi:MAG: N-acetylmuramoyl-L-alanine amidase [Candidatus Micrarchaeota archaeon]|nr:N-acetylmuramoyl-L-alanine amidase [Candidatus Micrarchaeota archaeon]
MNNRFKTLIIDLGHGGKDPGAVVEKSVPGSPGKKRFEEAKIVRKVGLPLISDIINDGKLVVVTSHQIAGKRMDETFTAVERRLAIESYSQKNPINLVVSIHTNAFEKESASGLVICHNNQYEIAKKMYYAMLKKGWEAGIRLEGNRKEFIQERKGLEVLRINIKEKLKEAGVLSESLEGIEKAIKDSLDQYKEGKLSLKEAVIQPLINFVQNAKIGMSEAADVVFKLSDAIEKHEESAILYIKDKANVLANFSPTLMPKFVPALLVEMGFITNPRDRQLMLEQPEVFASAIKEGIYQILLPAPTYAA